MTYGQLLLKAQEEIKQGRSVILDATFSTRRQRREARRLAEDADANLRFIECIAPEKILLKRLSDRKTGSSVSDARKALLKPIKAAYEQADGRENAPPSLRVNTTRPIAETLLYILSRQYP